MTQQALPSALPTDVTPNTYSGTPMTAYLLADNATTTLSTTVTTSAIAATSATAVTVNALTAALPSGASLDFAGVKAVLTAPAAQGATSLAVAALSGGIASGATALYVNFDEIPLAEDYTATLTSDEESIKIHGRFTPVRNTNGFDFTSNIKTIAGVDNKIVKRLVVYGAQGSPGNRARILYRWADGFCILATVNISAAKPGGAVGSTQRYEFGANLSGDLYWCDLNETTPQWYKIGTKAVPAA